MIHRTHVAGLPFRWVVADTVYGHSPDLRSFLEEHGFSYALAVPSTEVVCVQTRSGLLLSDVASIAQQAFRMREWQRLSQSQAPKASASLTGLACPSCRLAPPTGAIGSSYAAAWTTPTS